MPEHMADIFDVERFATHDGNGIRTTVFFKGCPLRCAWCHNPEGIKRKRQVLYMETKCIHCGSCVRASVSGGVHSGADHRICVQREADENWDRLVEQCPAGALVWDSRQYSMEELLQLVLRDEAFFRHGGGVTVSGGEPLLQADFIREFLQRLQKMGIHTAMESSLQAAPAELQKVLPYLDQIYADCKLFDCALHRHWTKQDNEQIKENIRWLLQPRFREKVVIRTPLIPEITATRENIASIAGFLQSCWQGTRYELLNYNPLAAAKYPLLGTDYCLDKNLPRYTLAELEQLAGFAKRAGLQQVSFER